jgi:hypothetical protein
MRADQIAGRGRIGATSAMSVGTWGRLCKLGEYVYVPSMREIVRLVSGIARVVNLESRL